MSERPSIVTDEHLEYLDELRASGVTNMYGSPAYVQRKFGVTRAESETIVTYWMDTFVDRHKPSLKGDSR